MADSAIGGSKDKPQLHSYYDKFTDTTTLESKEQDYGNFSSGGMKLSVVQKFAGQKNTAGTTMLHVFLFRMVPRATSASQMSDVLSDSTVALVLADTLRVTLHGTGHIAKHSEANPLVPAFIKEDVWFPITLEQLASLARAKTGGIRVWQIDMSLKDKIVNGAADVYRSSSCSAAN